ncbi:CYTH domain-containing protein [Streptococcus oricebi]|uniref:Adenylate cyclase n=1 Tax=Streptococcus oricebi TaxID=1547447 RepID=A0ABS5B5K0_9STRE|nr:CYTH domain-containing protein [Streptococcus oricebi]MBP2623254.1 adenylate cyclase [Streptococcus oricebi]
MNHLEIEFKTGLTQQEFQSLLAYFGNLPALEQTNYYIDSSDFLLASKRLALRIRTFRQAGELTLKIPQKVGSMEYNQELTSGQVQELLTSFSLPSGTIRDLLLERQIPLDQLGILGHLKTWRREKADKIGLLALDQNEYFDIRDYELEVEVTDASKGKEDFLKFLQDQGITYKHLKSKIARFSQKLVKS